MESIGEVSQASQYLTFNLAGEEYAIPVLRVKEIIEFCAVTRVPGTPSSIRGVMNLRGSVVPVINLAARFGLKENDVTRFSCIVIVEVEVDGETSVMGIMADSVNHVVDMLPEDIEEPPAFGTQVRPEYLTGMGKSGSKFALMLDIDRVLQAKELVSTGDQASGLEDVLAGRIDAGGDSDEPGEGV